MFTPNTYSSRRQTLCNNLKSQGGIVLLLGNTELSMNYPHNTYHFRQDSTFLYYFGLNHPNYIGVIDIDNGTETIYANNITLDDVIWMGKLPTVEQLCSSVAVTNTFSLDKVQQVISDAIKTGRKVHFLPPYRVDNTNRISDLTGILSSRVKDYVSEELMACVVAQREIKTSEEIIEIEKACDTAYRMHTTAMRMCGDGVLERTIKGTIEGIAYAEGAGISFAPIITINGHTLHNHCYDNIMRDGRLLLVDSGAETTMNYCSDSTRTLPISGKYTSKQKEIYDIVLAANLKAQQVSKVGVTYKEVHLEALRVLGQGLYGLGLIKGDVESAVRSGAVALFMPHGLGHQLGLDVHDMEDLGERLVGYDAKTERSTQFGLSALRMGKTLKTGHVLTVEPGIYFIPDLISKWKSDKINAEYIDFQKVEHYLDFGGIRIEDDILIEDSGSRKLGNYFIPSTTTEVEDFMAR